MGTTQTTNLCNTCAATKCDVRNAGKIIVECKFYVKDTAKTGEWEIVKHIED